MIILIIIDNSIITFMAHHFKNFKNILHVYFKGKRLLHYSPFNMCDFRGKRAIYKIWKVIQLLYINSNNKKFIVS